MERLVAFGASASTPTERPYTVVAYLEKAGYGSKAAAPVVKCMSRTRSADAGCTPLLDVLLADPLDVNSIVPGQLERARPRTSTTASATTTSP